MRSRVGSNCHSTPRRMIACSTARYSTAITLPTSDVRSRDEDLQPSDQRPHTVVAERAEQPPLGLLPRMLRLTQTLLAGRCEIDDVLAPVVRTLTALHEPLVLQHVDDGHHRRTVAPQPPRGLELR